MSDNTKLTIAGIVCLGLALLAFFGQFTAAHNAAVWASVPDATAGRLSDMPDGELLLGYGRLEQQTPGAPLAVFVVELCKRDDDGDCSWSEQYRVTPPVVVTVDGTPVRLANGDYQLEGNLAEVKWTEGTIWNRRELRARGFYSAVNVTVVGRMAQGGDSVQAMALYGGTPAEYRAGWVGLLWFLRIGAGILALVGVGLIGLALLPTAPSFRPLRSSSFSYRPRRRNW